VRRYPRSMSAPERSRVLVVDDDPVLVRLLELNFRLAGFAVESLARGDVVVNHASASPPDAIVLDVMLPGADGYEVCRELRDNPVLATVPVVLLSGVIDDERDGSLIGVDRLGKPFDPAELVAIVQRRIEERATA
jgi:DNA-binding response OmpR family regulator